MSWRILNRGYCVEFLLQLVWTMKRPGHTRTRCFFFFLSPYDDMGWLVGCRMEIVHDPLTFFELSGVLLCLEKRFVDCFSPKFFQERGVAVLMRCYKHCLHSG